MNKNQYLADNRSYTVAIFGDFVRTPFSVALPVRTTALKASFSAFIARITTAAAESFLMVTFIFIGSKVLYTATLYKVAVNKPNKKNLEKKLGF